MNDEFDLMGRGQQQLPKHTARLDELFLTGGGQLQLRNQTALIRGTQCYVLEALFPGRARYTVWIDPKHDFYPVRMEKNAEYRNDTFEILKLDRFDDVWFPRECRLTIQYSRERRPPTRNGNSVNWGLGKHVTEERTISITKVIWNPDHEALKSFVPDDIPNGSRGRIHERGLPPSPIFVWRDGRALDLYKAGAVLFDSGLRETNSSRSVPVYSPPAAPPPSAAAVAASKAAEQKQRTAAADKALKYNQDLAAKGDAYGQFRMGERYRDGDGVEKDMVKARDYFQKAAAQGHTQAAEAFKALSP